MDPLSDVLSLLKTESYLTAGFDAGGEWGILFDNRVGWIKCYAVASGSCLLSVEGVPEPVRLLAGDCFVVPSGRPFVLSSHAGVQLREADDVFSQPRRRGVVVHNGGGGVFMVGARFEANGQHASTLLRALPPIMILDRSRDQFALRWCLERLQEEVREQQPGSSLVANHLAHMMLVQVLRLYLAQRPNGGVGWFFALADPKIGAAITAIHEDPAHRWTLGELARRAGMSRSIFAERFRERVGKTPIAYLTGWRMMLAGERLAEDDSVAQVALSLGYESENAFNTAFKRVMGCSPRRYGRYHRARHEPDPDRMPERSFVGAAPISSPLADVALL